MKFLPLLFLILSASPLVLAQNQKTTAPPTQAQDNSQKGNGKISGVVLDVTTGKPVEFATVSLFPKGSAQPVNGAMCDDKGRFTINKVAGGEYKINVSFIGYEAQPIEQVVVKDDNDHVELGTIKLQADVQTLGQVEVIGEKPLIEDKVDRMVYNAEKDATSSGADATEVLKKVPMLTVDLDGNVQLRGSSNIRVLINNKPSTIMAASVADALRQIPADMIKTVEVITSPSAKYDAEGTAGIINIITKKNNIQGVNGSLFASMGTRYSNAGGSLNVRLGKLGINTNIGGNTWLQEGYSDYVRNDYISADTRYQTTQHSDYKNRGLYSWSQIGFDYDINPKNLVNGSARLNLGKWQNDNMLHTTGENSNGINQFIRDIDSDTKNNSIDLNLDYTHLFEKPQQEITTMALYSRSRRNQLYNLNQVFEFPVIPVYLEKSDNLNINEEITVQSDYVHPFENKTQLETGVKAILRDVRSDYTVSAFDNQAQNFQDISARSNIFNYQQNVGATYASYGFKFKEKYNFKFGARYEFTDINGDFESTSTTVEDQYHNLIPSATIMRDISQTQKLKASYSRRIQRPSIFYLNPYVNESDSRNISMGNPNLKPELTDSYELSYSTFYKNGNSINASVFLRQTNNAIESIRTIDNNGVSLTTFQNISQNSTYGTSVYTSLKLVPKFWTISGSVNLFYVSLNSPAYQAKNSSFTYNMNINSSWSFGKGYSAQFYTFYNSPRVQLQGTSSAWRYYNLAVKKEFLKDNHASVSIGLDNFLNKTLNFETESKGQNFDLYSKSYNQARGVRVSLNYRFGKMDFKQQRRRRSIRNDDSKQGDSNSGNGM